jgi:hypothetical protein
MVICDGGIVTSTVVSLLMNGLCCIWNEEMEVERREQLRNDIRDTYKKQRTRDKHEMVQWWRNELSKKHDDMNDRAKNYTPNTKVDAKSTLHSYYVFHDNQKQTSSKQRMIVSRKVQHCRRMGFNSSSASSTRTETTAASSQCSNDMASLLDEDEDASSDETDEYGSFVSISLH